MELRNEKIKLIKPQGPDEVKRYKAMLNKIPSKLKTEG